MEQILDQQLMDDSIHDVSYGTFWPRFWASMVDGILVSLIHVPLLILNLKYFKSPWLIILVSLLVLFYKPIMEFAYQATIGKKMLGLKVVNSQFQKANLSAILLRNGLQLIAGLFSLGILVPLLLSDNFSTINSFLEYSVFISADKTSKYVNYLPLLIAIIDVLCLLTDHQKRTLHDRIGKTFVIRS